MSKVEVTDEMVTKAAKRFRPCRNNFNVAMCEPICMACKQSARAVLEAALTPEPEIEVSEAMAEAAGRACTEHCARSCDVEAYTAIYRAMEKQRLKDLGACQGAKQKEMRGGKLSHKRKDDAGYFWPHRRKDDL